MTFEQEKIKEFEEKYSRGGFGDTKIYQQVLSDFEQALRQARLNALEEVEKKISYAYYCLENAIRHEREGTNIEGHEKDVDIYLSQVKQIIKTLTAQDARYAKKDAIYKTRKA